MPRRRIPSIELMLLRLPQDPGPLFTIGGASELIGRSKPTLRRWRHEVTETGLPLHSPTWVLWMFGDGEGENGVGLRVPLYDNNDIFRAQGITLTRRPGPAPGSQDEGVEVGSALHPG